MIDQMAEIVKHTGKLIVENEALGSKGTWEGTQFKAKADRMAHVSLSNQLQKLENIPIISEENLSSLIGIRPKRYWLIDPIDGTASFSQGYPGFVTQVALMEDDYPIMAAIYAPKLDSLYTAVKGKGGYHNGIRLSLNEGKAHTLIDNYPSPQGIAKEIYNRFSYRYYIECGSISLKICKVADGTADLFVKDVVVRDWDIAAPQLILEEAGGSLTDIQGKAFVYQNAYTNNGLIATNTLEQGKSVAEWYKTWKGKE